MERFIVCFYSQKLGKFNSWEAPAILTPLFIKGCTSFVFLAVHGNQWFLVCPSVRRLKCNCTQSRCYDFFGKYKMKFLSDVLNSEWNVRPSREHKSRLIGEVSTSHTEINTRQDSPERVISSSQRPLSTQQEQTQKTNMYALSGILTRYSSNQGVSDLYLGWHDHRDGHQLLLVWTNYRWWNKRRTWHIWDSRKLYTEVR